MFSRLSIRWIIPSSFQALKSAGPLNLKKLCCIKQSPRTITLYNNKDFPVRFYSAEAASQELVTVDYDYVKKATSSPSIYIIDVRQPEEIKEHGKIPNSINIPVGEVPDILGNKMSDTEFNKVYQRAKPGPDAEIIFYCKIGKRSGMAQQSALSMGYKNVKNYLGSFTEWASKQN